MSNKYTNKGYNKENKDTEKKWRLVSRQSRYQVDHEEVSRHTHPTALSRNDPATPKGSYLLGQRFPSRPGLGYWVCLLNLPLEGGNWKRKGEVDPLQGESEEADPVSQSRSGEELLHARR